jgi:carboxyl-terminal processing protease
VQSIYRLSEGAGLALTTAHYFTPAGRLIQRPWDETFDEYLSYTQKDQDVNKPHNAADLKRTDAGRPVYSGGGVEPDKYLAGPTGAEQGFGFSTTQFARMLYARQTFENYAQKYMATGDTRIVQQGSGRVSVSANFVVDEAMVQDYRQQIVADGVKIDEAAFAKDIDFIKAMIRYRIDEAVFGVSEARRHMVGADPQAQLALTMFAEAQKLGGLTPAGIRAH